MLFLRFASFVFVSFFAHSVLAENSKVIFEDEEKVVYLNNVEPKPIIVTDKIKELYIKVNSAYDIVDSSDHSLLFLSGGVLDRPDLYVIEDTFIPYTGMMVNYFPPRFQKTKLKRLVCYAYVADGELRKERGSLCKTENNVLMDRSFPYAIENGQCVERKVSFRYINDEDLMNVKVEDGIKPAKDILKKMIENKVYFGDRIEDIESCVLLKKRWFAVKPVGEIKECYFENGELKKCEIRKVNRFGGEIDKFKIYTVEKK